MSTTVATRACALEGKVALVLGGSRGIGAAIVRRLSAEGATVAFTYAASREQAELLAKEICASGLRARAVCADSSDGDAIAAALEEVVSAYGKLDILVVNAGILIRGALDAVSLADFDRMLAVNVRGVFIAVQAAVPYLPAGGRIVTIGSVNAERTAFPGGSVYSMTKGAVASMVRGIAIDLAPRGITVVNVQPGPTKTDMTPDEYIPTLRKLIPLQRLGTPDEIASLVTYLVGPESSFITGTSFTIDGGYLS
jgi:3-oxoacyl-[acyl-carrier protein] reductase